MASSCVSIVTDIGLPIKNGVTGLVVPPKDVNSLVRAIEKLLSNNMTDCFRIFNNENGHFSWWDYRAASFRRNRGVRIDHILASKSMSESCKACYIDKNPRKLERPSDHTPVVAEFDI